MLSRAVKKGWTTTSPQDFKLSQIKISYAHVATLCMADISVPVWEDRSSLHEVIYHKTSDWIDSLKYGKSTCKFDQPRSYVVYLQARRTTPTSSLSLPPLALEHP